ncbi:MULTISPECIES: hypothetical protein [unclassified Bradyrhizobium]|uniref:hypothetical protein n=1 Tax=unclassified Bradyrhizobium TaxID=2631580 RepID=UPI002915D583|nr:MULTISPECIES: hypothetical protein [unclassified Bradyrhizobium]
MFGLKRPTRIELRANDAAIVVRENGEMEMFIRQAKGDEELPPGQVVLAPFRNDISRRASAQTVGADCKREAKPNMTSPQVIVRAAPIQSAWGAQFIR